MSRESAVVSNSRAAYSVLSSPIARSVRRLLVEARSKLHDKEQILVAIEQRRQLLRHSRADRLEGGGLW
jgi:hypothetical protein